MVDGVGGVDLGLGWAVPLQGASNLVFLVFLVFKDGSSLHCVLDVVTSFFWKLCKCPWCLFNSV
jgi:hypothetical protein